MGWLRGLLSSGLNRPSADRLSSVDSPLKDFVAAIPGGAATHLSPIGDICAAMDAISEELKSQGLKGATIVPLLDHGLLGVCPKCGTPCSAEGLHLLWAFQRTGGNIAFSGGSAEMDRLAKGRCVRRGCSSSELRLFWAPDKMSQARDYLESKNLPVDLAAADRRAEVLAKSQWKRVTPPHLSSD